MPRLYPGRKDPDEILAHSIDWYDEDRGPLATGETIVTSVWALDADNDDAVLNIAPSGHPSSATATVSTVWTSAGTDGVRYKLFNTITTSAGQTLQESVWLKVAAK